jgi:hypothetical protein
LRAARQSCPAAELFYAYLLDDNLPSRRLFECEGFTAHPRRLLFHAVLPRLAQREPPPGFHLSETLGDGAAGPIDTFLRTRYEFCDTTAGHDGLFRLDHRGTRAWAALRRHGRQVFVQVPWPIALLGRLLPSLPRPGRAVHAWTLHHLGADGPEPEVALTRLLTAVAWVAVRQGIDAVGVPLFEDDPHNAAARRAALTRWGLAPVVNRLYVAGEARGEVLAAKKPLLMGGKDA